jgi:putative oxidoreductase
MGPWLYPLLNMGEITVLYCFFFLYLVTAGPGAFSLDGMMRRKS